MASSLHIAPKSRRESAASASTSTTGNPDFFSPLQPPTPPTSPATGITVDQKQLDAQSAALFEQLQKEALLQRKRAGSAGAEGGNDPSEQRFANQRSSTKFFVDENQRMRNNKINNADQSKKKHIDASSDLLPSSSGGGAQQRNQHIPKSEAFTIIPPGRAFLSRCSEGADSEAAKARWLSVKTLVAKSSSNAAVFPQSTADQIARDAILNEIEMRGVGRHFGRTAAKYSMKRRSLLRPAPTEEEQHLVQQRLQFSPAQQQAASSQQQEKGRRGRSNSKNNANATAASASAGYPNPYSTVIFNRRIAVSQVNENRHTDAEKRANEFLNHRQRLLSVRNTVCHNKFFVGKIKESALHKKKINELHMRQLLADSRRLQLQQAMTSRLYQLGMLRKEKSFNAVHMKRAQLLGLQ